MNLKRCIIFLFLVIFILSKSIAWGGPINSRPGHPHGVMSREANVLKILSFLENKISDQESLQKAKDKLVTLNERQTRLIASLSDRIADQGNTTGGDIAFLLMMALIVLS